MRHVAACVVVCGIYAATVLAQPLLPPAAPQIQTPSAPPNLQTAMPEPVPPQPPIGQMFAVRASGAVPQNPHMDEKLKPIAAALSGLPYTSYEALSVNSRELPWGVETLFPISAVHAFKATALSMDPEGAIALRARVEMLQGEDYINALDTQALAGQNQALLFRGIPLGRDELVIVMLVAMSPDPEKSGSPNQEGETESEGENQESTESESEGENKAEGEQEGENAPEKQESQVNEADEGEGESPKGVENLDALLESLDDIDRREQVEELKRRDRIDFKGDWW